MDAPNGTDPPAVRAHLLGPVRLFLGDRPLAEAWSRRSSRSLLLLLLATPGHQLPRDQVLDRLWPEATPAAALNALYVAMHGLRRVLEPTLRAGRASSYVEAAADAVRLLPHPRLWVDVDTFAALLAVADTAPSPARRDRLREALALYAGDLLAGEPYADWPVPRREALRQDRRRAALGLAELDLAAGEPLASTPTLHALLADEGTDEAALRALMRALTAAGQREEALRRYRFGVERLRDDLGVEPSDETRALAGEIETSLPIRPRPPLVSPPVDRFDNLPAPPNPLVGRARELETVQDLLWDPAVRLVTLTGPGGIGKTRLALEVARGVAEDFAAGVCFVALAAVRDPAMVVPTIARTLGVAEVPGRPVAEVLGEAIRERELLLVLDNAEQVVDAAPTVADLLQSAPRLKALVTSREPLHLRAEHEVPTPPLGVPDPSHLPGPAALSRYDAVALFVERARAVRPAFALAAADAVAAATLCARLDGLPLAIELAAARCRHRSPTELLAGLTDRFALLSEGYRDLPPRQRTMRDAIAWSHDLLAPEEQAIFRRLAVFAGGCTPEAIEAVTAAGGATVNGSGNGVNRLPRPLDVVASLIDKSLVTREDPDGGRRINTLETIREYGLERLSASGEEASIRRAHAAHFLDLAERAASELTGPRQATWLDRLETEHDNLRSVLAWALERGAVEVALRLGAALWQFWSVRGYYAEGRGWLARALAGGDDAPPPLRAAALTAAAELASAQGDLPSGEALFHESLAIWQHVDDPRATARALTSLGSIAHDRGDYASAVGLHEEAKRLYDQTGDRRGMMTALNHLASVAYHQGFLERADALWNQALTIADEIGDARSEAILLNNLGALAMQRDDHARATELHETSLARRRRLEDKLGIASSLANLGGVAHAVGDGDRAAALYEEAVDLFRAIGADANAAIALFNLGSLAKQRGDPVRAAALLRESLLLFDTAENRHGVASGLETLAGTLTALDQPECAARLFAAGDALRQAIAAAREPAGQDDYIRDLAATRAALGDAAFATAWAMGRVLTPRQALTEALGEVDGGV